MHYQLSRVLLSLILVFALLGQSIVPVVASCDMSTDSSMSMDMSHDHHTMAHEPSPEVVKPLVSEHNCCDTIECTCLDGTFTNTLIASLEQSLVTELVQNLKILGVDSRISSANTQLLIRPPIAV